MGTSLGHLPRSDTVRGELRILGRALREGWEIPPEAAVRAIEAVVSALSADATRTRLQAAKTLSEIREMTLKIEQFEFTSSGVIERLRQLEGVIDGMMLAQAERPALPPPGENGRKDGLA